MKSKVLFIILLLVAFLSNHYTRAISLYYNLILIASLNVFFTFYLLKINPFKKVGLFLIFFPVFLVFLSFVYSLIFKEEFFIINASMLIITTFIGFYFYKYQINRYIILIYLLFFSVSIFYYENILNIYFDSFNQVKLNVEFAEIVIKDKKGVKIDLPDNKIIVIDLWSNYCANCIKEFPKFEKLSQDFANNEDVFIFSLNIFHKNSDIKNSEKYLKKYTFQNFFTSTDIFSKLNFNAVPNYIVLDKNKKIVYFGSLNTKFKNSKSYIYDIIKNEFN
jgi:thiol-disulfide isomerase/thioredoxin